MGDAQKLRKARNDVNEQLTHNMTVFQKVQRGAWYDRAPGLDKEPAATPENTLNTPLMTSSPLNGNDADATTRATPAMSYFRRQQRSSSPHLVESANVGGSGQDLAHPTSSSFVEFSSPTFLPIEVESTRRVIRDECHSDAEEEMNDVQDDHAPPPPAMIAASFEASKPNLINAGGDLNLASLVEYSLPASLPAEEEMNDVEDDHAPSPPAMIAASFEATKPNLINDGDDPNPSSSVEISSPTYVPYDDSNTRRAGRNEMQSDEEEKMDEVEDDGAPLPPETTAASFESVKPEYIEDDNAPLPPEVIAASFEWYGEEESKKEEIEDYVAPAPPEMIAASFEVNDNATQDRKQILDVIEDYDFSRPNIFSNSIPDISNHDETHTDTEYQGNVMDRLFSPNLQPQFTAHEQVGAVSVSPSPPEDYDPSLLTSSQGHEEVAIDSTPESMARLPSNYQSLPLFEATLVHDEPDEPVYDAVPIDLTLENDTFGRSRKIKKYRAILCGWFLLALSAVIAVVVAVLFSGQTPENKAVSVN
jgi:hypothetical protein